MALLSYANRRQWAPSARGNSATKHFIFGFGRGVLPWYVKRIAWMEVGKFAESQKALRSWLSFICSTLLHPLQWLEMAPTEVYWQKKARRVTQKELPRRKFLDWLPRFSISTSIVQRKAITVKCVAYILLVSTCFEDDWEHRHETTLAKNNTGSVVLFFL